MNNKLILAIFFLAVFISTSDYAEAGELYSDACRSQATDTSGKKVLVYMDDGFGPNGAGCYAHGSSDSDLSNNQVGYASINERISSLIVHPGYVANVCVEKNYGGPCKEFTGKVDYVGDDYNDKISSIEVKTAPAQPASPPSQPQGSYDLTKESFTVVGHTPTNPTTDDFVTPTVGIDSKYSSAIKELRIYVDGIQVKSCIGVISCAHSAKYGAGEHTYWGYAVVEGDFEESDRKKFTVLQGPARICNQYLEAGDGTWGYPAGSSCATCAANKCVDDSSACRNPGDTAIGTAWICVNGKWDGCTSSDKCDNHTIGTTVYHCDGNWKWSATKPSGCEPATSTQTGQTSAAQPAPAATGACTGKASISISGSKYDNGYYISTLSILNKAGDCSNVYAAYSVKSDCSELGAGRCLISNDGCTMGIPPPTAKTTYYACIDMDGPRSDATSKTFSGSEISSGADFDPATGTSAAATVAVASDAPKGSGPAITPTVTGTQFGLETGHTSKILKTAYAWQGEPKKFPDDYKQIALQTDGTTAEGDFIVNNAVDLSKNKAKGDASSLAAGTWKASGWVCDWTSPITIVDISKGIVFEDSHASKIFATAYAWQDSQTSPKFPDDYKQIALQPDGTTTEGSFVVNIAADISMNKAKGATSSLGAGSWKASAWICDWTAAQTITRA